MSVLNIDSPGPDGFYGLHQLSISGNYIASSGGREIDILGINIEPLPNNRLRFWIVNNGISVDLAGVPRDATKVGANSTIEEFHLTRGDSELEFVKTVWSDAIQTPNSVLGVGDGGFLFTNDHGSYKIGAVSPQALKEYSSIKANKLKAERVIDAIFSRKCRVLLSEQRMQNRLSERKLS